MFAHHRKRQRKDLSKSLPEYGHCDAGRRNLWEKEYALKLGDLDPLRQPFIRSSSR